MDRGRARSKQDNATNNKTKAHSPRDARHWWSLNWLDFFTLTIIIFQVLVCPFTKVEESFPLQAIHDFIYHTTDLAKYDHFEFPGVVPRTFLGSLAVAAISSPIAFALRLFDQPKVFTLYLVRIVLGVLGGLALRSFRIEVKKTFGKEVEDKWSQTIALFALAAAVFRSELILLFAPMALEGLIRGGYTIKQALVSGIAASLASVALTVAFDSVMWSRPLWPEGEVFWYNTILNKSHNWGTSPFHWYFTSALPRALLGSIVLIPIGLLLERRVRALAWVAFAFVSIYSYLPHKELRFIIYSIPLWNVIAAVGLVRLYHNFNKGRLYQLAAVGAVALLFLSVVASSGFLYVSSHNYPAGYALRYLHTKEGLKPGYVHIDTYCAMNGISRFTEEQEDRGWRYSKQEDLLPRQYASFDYLLVGTEDLARMKRNQTYAGVFDPFDEVASVEGYDGIDRTSFPPHVLLAPKVTILQNRRTRP